MPFVYTSSEIEPKTLQAPEFTKRGLERQTTGRLPDIAMIGVPGGAQIAYDGYLQNIPAFIRATSLAQRVSCVSKNQAFSLTPDKLLPFALPPLMVSMKVPSKKDELKAAFKEKLPGSVEATRYIHTDTFICRGLTPLTYTTLPISDVDINTPSTPDSTSVIGMQSYLSTLKILTAFLATHSYPQFGSPDSTSPSTFTQHQLLFPNGPITATTGAHGNFGMYEARGITREQFDADAMFADVPILTEAARYVSTESVVLVAKPAPFYPDINCGPPSSIPNLPGYVLPWFPALHEPSIEVLTYVMRRYFFGSFVRQDGVSTWGDWLRGAKKWYRSDEGKAMTHIFFCIATALEAGARLYVVTANGQYLGATIQGYRMTINRDGMTLVPEQAREVRRLALTLDKHSTALEKIVELLSDMAISEMSEDTEELQVGKLTNSRAVHTEINRREKVSGKEYEDLLKAVGDLTFDEALWPIAIDRLERWLQFATSDDPIPQEWPMYLSPSLVYDTTRHHLILACFGPFAPSLFDAAGQEVAIPRGISAEDPASELGDNGKRSLESIFVTSKKLHVAVQDFAGIVKRRAIRQNAVERAAGFRTMKFTGNARDRIWQALKLLPYKETVVAGKRKARGDDDEDDVDIQVQPKRSKVMENAMALFDLSSF
jgi:hypothetical protein